MFLFEYLVFHTPKYIPGMDRLDRECKYKPFECEYYTMPASAKVGILQHLCDEVMETEACRSEINRWGAMAESNNWNSRYFSCKLKKADCMVEEYTNEFTDDGNGDECYPCRTEGNLICCDGCPGAYPMQDVHQPFGGGGLVWRPGPNVQSRKLSLTDWAN